MLEPWTVGLAEQCAAIDALQLEDALKAIVELGGAMATFHANWDVVLSPVTRAPPLPLGAAAPTRPFNDLWQTFFDQFDYTPLQNMNGCPSVSLPLGSATNGTPIGAMLSAARGGDETLLTLITELERAAPWRDRWP